MNIFIREYKTQDAEDAAEIWNQVVRDGVAFPQEKELTTKEADNFFKEQIYTELQKIRILEWLLDFISFIQIMSVVVGISVMPAMQ